ncbi:MAG: hypothetical protein BRD46_04190 [Bacteroidetes bacterium QS_8_68_15]|nr:MAG: hypothetical protein BRD46_04190 [Bacteroidetes bacterium QS_8_68_15]
MPPSLPLAEALAERLLARFPPDHAYDRVALEASTSTADASTADAPTGEAVVMPRTVRHFVERMMARRVEIEREHLRVLRQPWLDHEHADVRRAEEHLLEAVRRHVRIPAAAWERVLRHASGRVAAHLVHPVPTLADFVFGETVTDAEASPPEETDAPPDALSAEVVLRRLSYFAAYAYLRKAVRTYVEQRDVPSFQRERLATLLRRVDERMCAEHDTEDWLRLLQPLFALARVAYPDHDGVPVDLLDSFFDEKDADQPRARLREAARRHDLAILSPAALREILDGSAPTTATRKDEAPSEEQSAPGEQPAPDEQDEPLPLWKQFQQSAGSTEREERPPPPAREGGDSARPRWQQFDGGETAPERGAERAEPETASPEAGTPEAGTPPPSSAPPLRSLEEEVLGHAADNRALFVRELFDGSRDAYERVLHRLRGADDWSTATQIIASDVFRAYGVNIYSDAARSFTNAVEARLR